MTLASRSGNGRGPRSRAPFDVARGSILSLYQHRVLALFSLVSAFAIWFVIQDVENPRVTVQFPAEALPPSIEVRALNADRLIPIDQDFVSVDIEGREDDLSSLTPEDFEATIDVEGIPANVPTEVQVKVTSKRDGVKILAVRPSSLFVTVAPLEEVELEVRLNPSGQLASGYKVADQKIDPLTVKISGLRDRLDNVASVDLDVNLSSLREGTNVIEGELRARSASGNELTVALSPSRGEVTYEVEQLFVQRTVPVDAALAGQVAPGYRITNIVIEPPAISVSGPSDRMASLTKLLTEPIQLGNATGEIRRIQNIEPLQDLSPERRQVSVRIEVKAIECTGGAANTPCGSVVWQVGVVPAEQPTGLVILTSPLRLNVQLTGPLPALDAIAPGQITARVSLAGGLAGPGAFPVTVVIPANLLSLGVRAEQPPPMNITLGPGP